MAYSQGSKITAADYNEMVSRVNEIWGPGAGARGYGQPTIPTVTTGDKTDFSTVISTLEKIADHQNRSLAFDPLDYETGDKVRFIAGLESELGPISGSITSGDIFLNRFKFDPSNHVVTSGAGNAITYTSSWGSTDNGIMHEIAVTFSSNDHAETFFNAGGFVQPYVSSANASAATTDANWVAILSTVSASGLVFNAESFSSNNPTYPGSTSAGFYDLANNNTYVQAFNLTPSGYSTESYNIRVKRQDNVITFEVTFGTVSGGDVNTIDITSGVSIGTPSDASFTNTISVPSVVAGAYSTI